MPSFTLQGRQQQAAYWKCVGRDKDGQPILDTTNYPVTLDVRWDGTKRTVLQADGTPIAIDATICGLECDVPIGSAFWQGAIEDLPSGQVPDRNVYEVVTFSPSPTFSGRESYREATVIRKRDSV